MTTRLQQTFERLRARGEGALVPFLVVGDPEPGISVDLIEQLVLSGADILELGVPFSDPPGDGPVIQAAAQRALAAGTTTTVVFDILREVGARIAGRALTPVPVSLLCYYNVVLQYGVDAFYRDAAGVGVDAVLVADVPLEESDPLVASARRHGVHPVFMVSTMTSDDRLMRLASVGEGYLYAVAHVGVTGERTSLDDEFPRLMTRCRAQTALPLLAGFGIATAEHARTALDGGADGVICGSAIVRRMAAAADDPQGARAAVHAFMSELKRATVRPVAGG